MIRLISTDTISELTDFTKDPGVTISGLFFH